MKMVAILSPSDLWICGKLIYNDHRAWRRLLDRPLLFPDATNPVVRVASYFTRAAPSRDTRLTDIHPAAPYTPLGIFEWQRRPLHRRGDPVAG